MTRGLSARPTVLVVDDTDDTRFMLRLVLEMRGCRVVEAPAGWRRWRPRRECPGLVLGYLNMPRMDGMEATRRIRDSGEARGGTPVVAVTGRPGGSV